MTPARTAIRVIGSLVALVIVLCGGAVAFAAMMERTEQRSQALPAKVSRLIVKGKVGSIRVRAAQPGEQPGATMTSTWVLTKPTSTVTEGADGSVTLASTCPSNVLQTSVIACELDWDVVVPATASVDGRTSVGRVSACKMTGALTLATSVGEVSVCEGTKTSSITAETSTGGVSLLGVSATVVKASASVGDVKVRLTAAPQLVTATTSTGGATIEVPRDRTQYRVTTKQSVGSSTSSVPDSPAAANSLTATTSVGDAEVNYVN